MEASAICDTTNLQGAYIMRKNKKAIKISVTVLFIAIISIVCAYFGYASTLINPDSEKSLNKYLGANSDSIITVLAQKKHNDYLGIYYIDSNSEAGIRSFVCLKENKICKNRYNICGGGSGNTSVKFQSVSSNDNTDDETLFYFIYGYNTSGICTMVELINNDSQAEINETFEIPENEAFIIVKEFNFKEDDPSIMIFDGNVSEQELADLNTQLVQ